MSVTPEIDAVYEQLLARKPSCLRTTIVLMGYYHGMANYVAKMQEEIAQKGDKAEPQLLREYERWSAFYARRMGIPALPRDQHEALVQKLAQEVERQDEEWRKTPAYAEERRQIKDFLD